MSDNPIHVAKIAQEINLQPNQVRAVRAFLADGATVPFIARYRKEATGSLDEVQITAIRDRLEQLEELDQRREAIIKSLGERNLLTEELGKKLAAAETMTVLEDIYLPLRPKKRTRATIAREKGLEPLADFLFQNQTNAAADPSTEAHRFLVEAEEKEKAVSTVEDALAGARDILAERMNDDESARNRMRDLFHAKGISDPKWLPGKRKRAPNLRITLIGTNRQPKRRPIGFSLFGEVNRKVFFIFGFSRRKKKGSALWSHCLFADTRRVLSR